MFDGVLPAACPVQSLVAAMRPDEPLHILHPTALRTAAAEFTTAFPGRTLYAVKCNPEPEVLRALWAGGVREFDCASLPEIALVRGLFPTAGIHFMHPIKSRSAIRDAHALHGVRSFVLDSAAELAKIRTETGNAPGLTLVVRLALPKGEARLDLSGKFGAPVAEAAALLRAARPHAARLGLSFHVGSQCLDPAAWRHALALAGDAIALAQTPVDIIDVGGGFPAPYPGMTPPPLAVFMAAIRQGAAALPPAELWSEPGRALVATGASLVVQVLARRGTDLFINDGTYGTLSDAGSPAFRYPTRLLRSSAAPTLPFRFLGPTCDSADTMPGPFHLPADIEEGDHIEITHLGAYGTTLRTTFNGFGTHTTVTLDTTPEPAALPA